MNIREIEHDRLLENLKTALQEYVDYAEYIKRANAVPKKRRHSNGQANQQNGHVQSATMTVLRRGSEGFKQQNYPITANGCEAR